MTAALLLCKFMATLTIRYNSMKNKTDDGYHELITATLMKYLDDDIKSNCLVLLR